MNGKEKGAKTKKLENVFFFKYKIKQNVRATLPQLSASGCRLTQHNANRRVPNTEQEIAIIE